MQYQSKRSLKYGASLFSWILLLAASGCAVDSEPNTPTGFTCPGDGFCVQAVGSKSLAGGYRKGTREIKFEAAYRPYLSIKPDPSKWSVRLLDWKGMAFSQALNENAPDRWLRENEQAVSDGLSISSEELRSRNDLIKEMYENRSQLKVPRGRDEAWRKITFMIEVCVSAINRVSGALTAARPLDGGGAADRISDLSTSGQAETADMNSLAENDETDGEEDPENDRWRFPVGPIQSERLNASTP